MGTPQLYDVDEEYFLLKIHAGNGGIFLRDYVNIDLSGILVGDATEEQRRNNLADITDYYGRLEAEFPNLPQRRMTICDEFMDMTNLRFPLGSIDKIVAIQTFEHLSPIRAYNALLDWWGKLRHGGTAIISVPDMYGTINLLKHDDTREFAIRHLLGSQRGEYNWHLAWYTHSTLAELCKVVGFAVEELENVHLYPSIMIRLHKV